MSDFAQTRDKKIENYLELLLSWVGKIRLTGAQSERALREQIQDAIYMLPYLPETGNGGAVRIIDVGTGGGLPGVVWAIKRPRIKFTLLDSIRKKCMAVEQICGTLLLKNTKVVCARAETYATEGAGIFDVATARAVAAVPKLLEWLAPFPKKGGLIIAPKGPKYREEVAAVTERRLAELKLGAPEIIRYGDDPNRENFLLIWKKQ
ncbi:MAG: 16S rRNA (guanine(527)-N(7))-methyltransferase RsmG [Synergistaceae bacterium]|nr:16S rRNA (guanine(527)-N(7))-methyltransferase RsmG [Synergistaceae bacterium]